MVGIPGDGLLEDIAHLPGNRMLPASPAFTMNGSSKRDKKFDLQMIERNFPHRRVA